jgi:hypothetical protein
MSEYFVWRSIPPTHFTRRFVATFWFVSWTDISLGINIDVRAPRIEIHLPFGFLRFGWLLEPQWGEKEASEATR